jgi:hypothetical protein
MPIAFLNRARGSTRAFDPDVLAWRDAVIAKGGSVSLARLIVVDQFVFSEKTAGLWPLTDDYLGFWSSIESVAVLSVTPRDATSVVATVRYVLRSGGVDTENRWLSVVPGNQGLLVYDSERIGPA